MTAQEIYEIASSFLYEIDGEDADSKRFSVGFINILLQEALDTENSIRVFNGAEKLERAPYIKSLDEEIPYDDAIIRAALPYGVASFFFQEAMNNFQAENYRGKFISALNDAQKFNSELVENVYGDSAYA